MSKLTRRGFLGALGAATALPPLVPPAGLRRAGARLRLARHAGLHLPARRRRRGQRRRPLRRRLLPRQPPDDRHPRARRRRGGALDLDGFFGFHPSLGPLKEVWDDGGLAVVQAAGMPVNNHSHFDWHGLDGARHSGRAAAALRLARPPPGGGRSRRTPRPSAPSASATWSRRRCAARSRPPRSPRSPTSTSRGSRTRSARFQGTLAAALLGDHLPRRPGAADLRRRRPAGGGRSRPVPAGERRRLSGQRLRQRDEADRPADQGRPRAGGRLRRPRRLGHARHRERPDARPAGRLRRRPPGLLRRPPRPSATSRW